MVRDAAAKYLRTQVETASPEQLVTMLYDGALRFGDQAAEALGASDSEAFCEKLGRVQAIVLELSVSLDRAGGGEMAANLAALYAYVHARLIEADIEKDPERLREALRILRELRDGWSEGMKALRTQSSPAAGEARPAGV